MRGYKTPPRFPARESNLASDNELVTSANDKGDGRMNRRGRRAVSTRLRNGSRVKGGRNERGRVAVPSISAPIIQRASDPSNPKFHSVSPNSSNSNSLFDRFHSLFTCKFYTFHILCQYAYSKAIIGDKRVTRIIRFELGNDRYRFQLTVSLITARRLFSYARRTLVIAFFYTFANQTLSKPLLFASIYNERSTFNVGAFFKRI